MGVVYKFRKEVIDFVLQQKRTDHDLGCRQLAVLTSEKFKIQVSKSSVNAIIKNANLSNVVGRPVSSEPAPKKFQIPSQKKQQLLDEVRKVKIESIKIEQKPLNPALEPEQPGKTPVIESRKRGFSQAVFSRHVENMRARRSQIKGVMREGMGCIFLKAAQWQLSKSSVLGGLLRKHIQGSVPAQFDAFCDILPCLNLLGAHSPDNPCPPCLPCLPAQRTNHALWYLNGLEQPPGDQEISRWDNLVLTVSPSIKFFLEYEKQKRQVFMEAERFEFHLGNGDKVVTDACLTGLGDEDLLARFPACAEQAMTMLSHCVISNNQPAIFLSSADRLPAGGGKQRFPGAVLDMVAAFEGMENKQFKKVLVFDTAGEEIAGFSLFPRKKRFFMLGVWPGQEEFLSLSKNTKTVEPFYDTVTDKIFYAAAGPATIFQQELKSEGAPLRSITVLASPESAPTMVILTNCADNAPADILQAFLGRWPNLDAGPAGRAFNAAGSQARSGNGPGLAEGSIPGGQNASMIFQDWGGALNRYCQKQFFGEEITTSGITQLTSMFYSLPGHFLAQEQVFLVSLCPPPAYSCLNALQQAVQRINEAGITDPNGRSLFINIVK